MAYLQEYNQLLTIDTAAHLLRRATSGPTKAEITQFTGLTALQAYQTLLNNIIQNPPEPIVMNENSAYYKQTFVTGPFRGAHNFEWSSFIKYWWEAQLIRQDTPPSLLEKLAVFWQIDGYAEMLSGLVNVYAPEHMNRIHREIELNEGEIKESLVQCYRLDSLLNLHNIVNIDYCSIDVEGAEMQVLESIDFERVKIKVITIENNYKTSEVKMFMKKNKYIYFGKIGSDEIYIISDSHKINFMYFMKKIRLIIKSVNESILFYFKTRIFGSGSLKHTKNS